jgi:DNA-3-methyladenine glycosylase
LEPIEGLEIMRKRRPAARPDSDLASGPGKLTQALAITLDDYGADLTRGQLVVRQRAKRKKFEIDVTPRIGISKCVDSPLRFLIRE